MNSIIYIITNPALVKYKVLTMRNFEFISTNDINDINKESK